jgi:hypothetical protein
MTTYTDERMGQLLRCIEQLEAEATRRASELAQAWVEAAALREQVAAATTLVNETTMRANVADAVHRLGGPAAAARAWGATLAQVHDALCYSDSPIAAPIAAALGVRYVEMYIPDEDAAIMAAYYRAQAVQP